MAATSLSLLHVTPPRSATATSCHMSTYPLRRRSLPLLLLSPAISTLSFNVPESKARDIPIFGLRDKIEKAEEVVKEEIGKVEEEIGKVEEEIVKAEEEVKEELQFGAGGLAQAAVVAGVEAVAVLLGVSVVNGILGPKEA